MPHPPLEVLGSPSLDKLFWQQNVCIYIFTVYCCTALSTWEDDGFKMMLLLRHMKPSNTYFQTTTNAASLASSACLEEKSVSFVRSVNRPPRWVLEGHASHPGKAREFMQPWTGHIWFCHHYCLIFVCWVIWVSEKWIEVLLIMFCFFPYSRKQVYVM